MSIISKGKTVIVPSAKYNINLICDDMVSKDKSLKICKYYVGKAGILELLYALAMGFFVLSGKKIKKGPSTYLFDFMFPIMTFARYYTRLYNNHTQRQYLNKTLEALQKSAGKENGYKGIDIFKLVQEKVSDDLIPHMMESHFQAFGLKKGIEIMKPTYVISQMASNLNGALGEITKEFGIRSVLVSHGSHVLQPEKYAAREHEILAQNILVGEYRYLAVQSPLAREMALHLTKSAERIINIMPTIWGRAVDRTLPKHSRYLTIVHAGSFKMRHNRRYIYETADEFVMALKDLCEIVSEFTEMRLIIKTRPQDYELSLESLKTLLPKSDNIFIKTKGSFEDVLKEADLVVSFSSTTIEEALSNKVPVLLYGGYGRYTHIPVEPFCYNNGDIYRAVTFVKDRHNLKRYFTELNRLGNSFEVPNDKFKDYCFDKNEALNLVQWLLGLG